MPFLEVGRRRIEYSVLRGTSRRYTYFRLRPDLTLEVILPRGKNVDVEKEIRSMSSWLQREQERLSRARKVLTEGSVMYDGTTFRIVASAGREAEVSPDFARGEVRVPATDGRSVRELIRRWFLKESSAYVVKKVAELAPKVGKWPTRVDVREIGRWGYCTHKGRLSFSWQLAALPERLREYVILHELTHLTEFNHSQAFKRKLVSVCPDFRDRERELDLVVPYGKLTLG